ncbi:response regulator, partial [Paenibacillus sp. EKM208P]
MRILIVDDNPTNVIIIREILKKENYRDVISASSAAEMLEHLGIGDRTISLRPHPSDIDLVLLDMMMPEMDG